MRRLSWLVLALIAAATVFFAVHAAGVRVDFTLARLYGEESAEYPAYERFRDEFGTDDLLLYVAFPTPDAFGEDARRTLRDLAARVADVPGVRGTYSVLDALARMPAERVASSPLFRGTLFGEDGKAACLWILLDGDVLTAERRGGLVEAVRAALPDDGREYHLSGLAAVENEYVVLTLRDLRTFLPLAGAIFLVLLAVYFRNVAGTLLPIVAVAVAIVWTVGALSLTGFTMSILSSLIPELVLILGIADGVHLLSRHGEDLRAEPDRRKALSRTLSVMVPACFLTSFTTSAGFASLSTTGVGVIREFGLWCAGGILAAFVVAVTFIPAALDRLPPFRGRGGDARFGRFWDRLLEGVARANEHGRPVLWTVTAAAVVVSVFGIQRLRMESSWLHDLRPGNRVHRAHVFFHEHLTGVFALDLRVDGPVGDPGWLRRVAAFQDRVLAWRWEGRPGVRHVTSYVDAVRELDPGRALPGTEAGAAARLALVRALQERGGLGARVVSRDGKACRISLRMNRMTSKSLDAFGRDVEGLAEGLDVTVTGKTWLAKQAMDRVVRNMVWSLGVASAAIFISMSILFRSARIGLISMVPNIIPMIFTAGFMGWMGIDLNFSTVTVFSIALGIAVDSTIHYIARLRLELAKDPEPRGAMRRAVRGAGAPMIFSTVLLVVGFGSILTSNFVFTFHFGLLGGVALVTALFGDLFVAPSLFMVFVPRARV